MRWRVTGAVQKVLGYLPLGTGEAVHYLLQRRLGGLRDFGREHATKVDDWRIMAGHLRDAQQPIAGARLLEIRSGWHPTLPFCCYLGGAARVTTVDLSRHLKPALTRRSAQLLGNHLEMIAAVCGVAENDVHARYERLVRGLAHRVDLAAATGGVVEYRTAAHAHTTRLVAGSVDAIFSNSALEHIPPLMIERLFREAMRLLPAGGVMFHAVNCGDHYAHDDRSISQLNYLRYSDAAWAKWNNHFLYQNRMRAHAFAELAARAGFTIEVDTARPTEVRLRELERIEVHPQFAHLPPRQLCVTSVDFVARKPPT